MGHRNEAREETVLFLHLERNSKHLNGLNLLSQVYFYMYNDELNHHLKNLIKSSLISKYYTANASTVDISY